MADTTFWSKAKIMGYDKGRWHGAAAGRTDGIAGKVSKPSGDYKEYGLTPMGASVGATPGWVDSKDSVDGWTIGFWEAYDQAKQTWSTPAAKPSSSAKFTIPSGGIKPQASQTPAPQTPAPGSAPATPSTREPGGDTGARPGTSPTSPITDTRLPPPDREEYQPAAPPAPAASSDNTVWWVAGAAGLGLIAWALVAGEKKTGR